MMQTTAESLRAGGFEITLDRRLVTRNGDVVHLTRTEWKLLEYLALNVRRVVLSDEILRDVWGPEYEGDWQHLRLWISRLRRKLSDGTEKRAPVKTMQGIGYMLDAEPVNEPESAL